MASTKLYLDLRGKAKDGKGSIVIIVYHNASTTSIATGIRVSPSNWQNQKVIKLHGAEAINASLQEKKLKIDKSIALLSLEDGFDRMTASDIKQLVSCDNRNYREHLISDLFHEYMSTGNLEEGTKIIYRQTLQKVVRFGGNNLKIENMNLKWLREFDSYLSKTQCANGRAIYIRHLRAVFNYARHNNIICPYPFDNFHIKQEETEKLAIPVEQLREFLSYPTSKSKAMYRDYFFLMFYLIGINTIDLLKAKKSQIINGRLEYIRSKTHKKYSIKIEPEAWEIIHRYEGKGEYILDALDHCQHYRSFAHQMNDALKLIGPETEEEVPASEDLFSGTIILKHIEPVVPGISTNSARHTWATMVVELGYSSDIASFGLGHSPTNRTTFIYIKPDQGKVDEANRAVIDYLLGNTGNAD